jgi:hypothetical protein
VNGYQRLGDWEVDTVVGNGQKQTIITITERKSRLALIRKVDQRTALAVKDDVLVLLQQLMTQTMARNLLYTSKSLNNCKPHFSFPILTPPWNAEPMKK